MAKKKQMAKNLEVARQQIEQIQVEIQKEDLAQVYL